MDRPLQRQIQLQIRPSRLAHSYCSGVCGLAWLAIAAADLPWWSQALLAGLVGWQGWRALRAIRQPRIACIRWQDGQWRLQGSNAVTEVVLDKRFFLTAGLVSLPFQSLTGEACRIVLWPDSADADSLRRLRVLLRS